VFNRVAHDLICGRKHAGRIGEQSLHTVTAPYREQRCYFGLLCRY
jgi:hypothetical protein